MNKLSKAKYGIDAPLVVINLFIFSIIQSVFTYLSHKYLITYSPFIYWTAIAINGLGALYCFGSATGMLISSKWLKRRFVKKFVNNLHLQGFEKVLDAGSGSGIFVIEIAKKLKSGKAYGIDFWESNEQSKNQITITKQNVAIEKVEQNVELISADLKEIPFNNSFFDVIVCCLTLNNIEEIEDREKVISELYRILKPKGKLYIIDFAHIKEYSLILNNLMIDSIHISTKLYQMIPPLKTISVVKA